jgi:hypothetical protein
MAKKTIVRSVVRKAYRALRRAKLGSRVARAGANNVGKAMYKKATKRRSYSPRRRTMRRRPIRRTRRRTRRTRY